MDMLIGFVVGCYIGAKGGAQRLNELGEPCGTSADSPEFQVIVSVDPTRLAAMAVDHRRAGGSGGFGDGQPVGDQLKQVLATLNLPTAA